MGVEIRQSAFWMTNTGIITAPDGSIVLIDPGVLPDELSALATQLGESQLVAAISTHEDWDHVLWSPELPPDLPRLAHLETARILAEERGALLRGLTVAEGELGVRWEHDLVGRLQPVEGDVVELVGMQITFIPTPGHTPGHTSLWLEEEGILFAGDMLSDIDIPMLAADPDAADACLRSLAALERLLERARLVIPGHGSTCDGAEAKRRLAADRSYIDALFAGEPVDADPRMERQENREAHEANRAAIGPPLEG